MSAFSSNLNSVSQGGYVNTGLAAALSSALSSATNFSQNVNIKPYNVADVSGVPDTGVYASGFKKAAGVSDPLDIINNEGGLRPINIGNNSGEYNTSAIQNPGVPSGNPPLDTMLGKNYVRQIVSKNDANITDENQPVMESSSNRNKVDIDKLLFSRVSNVGGSTFRLLDD